MATANISNRISLDGGDDIRKQVLAIADEADKLFKGIQGLADQLGRVDSSRLEGVQSQLQGASQAAGQASSQVQGFGEGLLSFAGKTALGIGALAVAAGGIISSIAASAAGTTAALADVSSKLGLSAQSYQALKKGADDAGISVDNLNRILGNIDKAATQAAGSVSRVIPTDTAGRLEAVGSSLQQVAGGLAVAQQSVDAFGRSAGGSIDLIQKFGDQTVTIFNGVSKSAFDLAKASGGIQQGARAAAGALAELGISAQLLSQLTPDQRLQLIALQLDKIPDSAAKASLAAKLFGDEWRKALEFIKQLPNTLADSDGSLRAFSDSEIASGKKLKGSLEELSAAFTFLKDKVGLLFAAGQTARAEWLTKLIDDARKLLFGFIAADDAKKKLLEAGQFDFFKDLDLDKFQEFLNQSGESGLAKAIGLIRDVSRDLALVWSSVLIPAGQAIIAGFNGIAEQINSVFGSDISGRFVAIVAAIGLLTGAFGALRAVFSPVVSLFGFLLSTIGSLGPLLLAGAVAIRAFWAELRSGGTAAIAAVRAESVGFLAAFSQLARGNFSGAWALFKSAALDAFAGVSEALGKIFGGEGSAVFTSITRLISGVALAASGLAAIFNAIFGTNLNAEGLLLVAVLAQLVGAFGLLAGAGRVVAVALTPLGAAFLAIAASAVILARQFPDLGKSWEQVTGAFSNLLSGDFDKAFKQLGDAFAGVWDNLKNQGVVTWAILGAGAIAVSSAVAGLIGQVRTLAAILLPLSPIVAALASAGLIASDFTRQIDPLQKKMEDLNREFSKTGDLEAYNKALSQIGETATDAASKNAGTTRSFADSWKAALDQIKATLGETGTTAKQAADQIAPPLNQAAGKIAAPFNQAAGKIASGFKGAAQEAGADFAEIGSGSFQRLTDTGVKAAGDFGGVWRKIAEDGTAAANSVAGGFQKAADNSFSGFREVAKGVWQKIPDDAKAAGDATKQITDEQWKAITDTITQSLDGAKNALDAFKGGEQITQDLSTIQDGFQSLGQSAQELGPRISEAFTALQSGTSAAASQFQTMVSAAQGLSPPIDAASASAQGLGNAFAGVTFDGSSITSSLDGVIGKLSEATAAAQAMAAAVAAASAASSGDATDLGSFGFAGGGYTGAGGTFEPAGIVHRGEYVQPAHVVRQPGVLAFMEMLRQVGGDLRAVFANFGVMPRGFSFGGLVDSMSRNLSFEQPRFAYAGGGLVNAGPPGLHPIMLQFGSGDNMRTISGLHATPSRARELQKEALLDRMRSSRTPSRWSGG